MWKMPTDIELVIRLKSLTGRKVPGKIAGKHSHPRQFSCLNHDDDDHRPPLRGPAQYGQCSALENDELNRRVSFEEHLVPSVIDGDSASLQNTPRLQLAADGQGASRSCPQPALISSEHA